MNFNVEKIDPHKTPEWSEFITLHPDSMVYHHPAWLKAVFATFSRAEDFHLGLKDDSGKLIGILPGIVKANLFGKKLFHSLPLTSYVSPLFQEGNGLDLFLNFLDKKREEKKIDEVEIRFLNDQFLSADILNQCGQKFVTQFLAISDDCISIWKNFHPTSVRQRIIKARKMPYELEIRTDEESLAIFYHLHALSRRRIGLPPLPKQFFVNLWRFLIPANLMKVLLLKLSGKFVSAMILLIYKTYAHAEYTATDPKYLKFNANHLITWRAIEIAIDEGCRIFDFGRTDIRNKGLFDYKKRWGTSAIPLFYYQNSRKNLTECPNNSQFKTKVKPICKHLPISLLKLISSIYAKINL